MVGIICCNFTNIKSVVEVLYSYGVTARFCMVGPTKVKDPKSFLYTEMVDILYLNWEICQLDSLR